MVDRWSRSLSLSLSLSSSTISPFVPPSYARYSTRPSSPLDDSTTTTAAAAAMRNVVIPLEGLQAACARAHESRLGRVRCLRAVKVVLARVTLTSTIENEDNAAGWSPRLEGEEGSGARRGCLSDSMTCGFLANDTRQIGERPRDRFLVTYYTRVEGERERVGIWREGESPILYRAIFLVNLSRVVSRLPRRARDGLCIFTNLWDLVVIQSSRCLFFTVNLRSITQRIVNFNNLPL